jgi:ubiquinone/menaquinone biosynthesis C-methylase UbiE
VDTDHLGPAQLFPVDQLHAGGPPSTKHALDRLGVRPGLRLLDVGSGIGGTSRMAAMSGAAVTGIDLSPEFVEAATELSERVGLGDQTTFLTTPGESLPLADGTFEAAVMIHVGMNIPDKQAVFTEVHRVLEPGGLFAVYEQMRADPGELPYPLPWAEDERSSFVETVEEYTRHLEAAGFTIDEVEDRTSSTLGPPPAGPVNNAVVFGQAFVERIGNNIAATKAGLLRAELVVARA